MKIPVPPHSLRVSTPCVRIESARGCDGSICHQPIFNEDGGLNPVAAHFHLIEWDFDIHPARCYAVFGEFSEV